MDLAAAHRWESTEICGNARVHQGDAHTKNNFNFASGSIVQIFTVDRDLEHPGLPQVRTAKRLRDAEGANDQCLSVAKRVRYANAIEHFQTLVGPSFSNQDSRDTESLRLGNGPYWEHHEEPEVAREQRVRQHDDCGALLANRVLQAISSTGVQMSQPSSNKTRQEIEQQQGLEVVKTALKNHNREERGVFLGLLDHLRRNPVFPSLARLFPSVEKQHHDDLLREATSGEPTPIEPPTTVTGGPAQDLAATFLAILAFIACDNTDKRNSAGGLVLRQQGPILSLIPALIAFAVARYFCFPRLLRGTSDLSGSCAIIKDPFLTDLRIPVSHCEDFEMVRAFLQVRLSGTTAERFVKAEQFNLTLGRRAGPAIRKTDWSVKGRDWSNKRLIMAVYVRRDNAICVECAAELQMSDTGHFVCHPCGKLYGNCAALKYLTSTVFRPATRATHNAPEVDKYRDIEMPEPSSSDLQIESEEEDDDNSVTGLKSIDFRILRRQSPRSLPTQEQKIVSSVSSTILYLGNLPRLATTQDIGHHFSMHGAGKITEIKVMNGFGFVEFEDPMDARSAVPALHGSEFLGERLIVQFPRGRKNDSLSQIRQVARARRTDYRMLVTGLPPQTMWQDLKDFVQRHSYMDLVYVEISPDGSQGLVEFDTAANMESAVQKLQGHGFRGSTLHYFTGVEVKWLVRLYGDQPYDDHQTLQQQFHNDATNSTTLPPDSERQRSNSSTPLTMVTPQKSRRAYTEEQWTQIRPIFEDLYSKQKLTLREVMERLCDKYDFRATEKMYKTRIKAWGLLERVAGSGTKPLKRLPSTFPNIPRRQFHSFDAGH